MAYDNTITLDENHPDPRVAAGYADQASRKFTRNVLRAEIQILSAKPMLDRYEDLRMQQLRGRLAEVEQAIKDNEPTTEPED